jgi:hypothetical protein
MHINVRRKDKTKRGADVEYWLLRENQTDKKQNEKINMPQVLIL